MSCGVGCVGPQSRARAFDVVEDYLAVGFHHRQAQVENRPEDFDDSIRVFFDEHVFPATLTESLIPDPRARCTGQAVAHGGRQFIRGSEVMLQQGLDFGAGLNRQSFPGIVLIGFREQQVGGRIVDAPLGMTDLAGNAFSIELMDRMLHGRNRIFLAAPAGGQHQGLVPRLKIAKQRGGLSRPPIVTAVAGQGRGAVVAAALMAVDAGQAALLMDIRRQIVVFNPIRAGRGVAGCIRGAVLPVVIVFVPAVVIAAHIVCIVAAQALIVRWRDKGVGLQLSSLEREMAGAATRAMGNCGVIVTRGIDMAAQAATAEHVVGQRLRRRQSCGVRDVRRCVQRGLRAEMPPDRVDFVMEGEMQGLRRFFELLGMTAAAGYRHVRRMGGPGDQSGMGLLDPAFIVKALMAGYAGQVVGGIQLDVVMAADATDFSGRRHCGLGRGRSLSFWRSLLGTATAQKQENNE